MKNYSQISQHDLILNLGAIIIYFAVFIFISGLSTSLEFFFKNPNLNLLGGAKIVINISISTLDVVFRHTESVLKDSTAFVYVTKSETSSHFTLIT